MKNRSHSKGQTKGQTENRSHSKGHTIGQTGTTQNRTCSKGQTGTAPNNQKFAGNYQQWWIDPRPPVLQAGRDPKLAFCSRQAMPPSLLSAPGRPCPQAYFCIATLHPMTGPPTRLATSWSERPPLSLPPKSATFITSQERSSEGQNKKHPSVIHPSLHQVHEITTYEITSAHGPD